MAVVQPEQTAMSLSDLPSTTSIPRNNIGKIQLPANFVPTEFTVICGRGKARTNSIGNRRLKSIVNSFLKPYSEAKNRLEKSAIVSSIVGAIKHGGGNFVKCEFGIWWEVDDALAREKVGCLLRDYLHAQYRSSTKAKLAIRKARRTMAQESTSYLQNYDDAFARERASCLLRDSLHAQYRSSTKAKLAIRKARKTTALESTSNLPNYDTYLPQGSYTSNESQSRMLKDASSSTAEGIYCPSPSLSYQPMMQGTIGKNAYMTPVKSTTNCVQGSSYVQQQPSEGTSEYCSLFYKYIEQQRNLYNLILSTDPAPSCWNANNVRSGTSLQLFCRSHRNRY
jgi:hypothetical protein